MKLQEAVRQLVADPKFTKEKDVSISLNSKGEKLDIPWRLVLDGEWSISIPITDPEFLADINGVFEAMGIEPKEHEKETIQ